MSWSDTPFDTLEEAHALSEHLKMQPSAITVQGEYRTFTVLTHREGRRKSSLLMCAQHVQGGTVKQRHVNNLTRRPVDPDAPHWGEHDRLGVDPWVTSDYATLEEAVKDRVKNVLNYKPPKLQGTLVVFTEPKGEYIEYLDPGEGPILIRSLRPVYPDCRENDGY